MRWETGDQRENIEPVEEDNGERLNQVGHKPKPGTRDFTHQVSKQYML